jgi:hypothetical protein
MASFESTRSQFTQEHFEVFELDLPVITGTCTQGAANGFGTPLTCDQSWTNEYKTYKFTNQNAPLLSGGAIYRYITKITENPTELKPGNGLSARGSLTITLRDFVADPNEGTAGVTTAVKTQGTFLGKLNARQIMENKTARLKLYRVQSNGTIDLAGGAETHHYIVESFKSNDNGTWTVQCKDVMSLANLDEKTWPPTAGGFLRLDINETANAIPVDAAVDYSAAFAVRIGDEHFRITSVTGNQTSTAALNVAGRGSTINAPVSGVFLTQTTADSHSAGDEVFICDLSDDETIDSLITRVLIASDFDSALIPAAALAAEVAEWHPNDKINTLHSEAEDVNDVLNKILTGFLMDLWFDQIDNEIKLSAISVWKESSSTLTEGREIDAYTLKRSATESLRASRALVIYGKRDLADNDDAASFSKGAQNADNQIISAALYKEHKDKRFDNNTFIGTNAAELLVQRTVARFKFTPFSYNGLSQERFLAFNGVRVKTGDVVNLNSQSIQSPNGLPSAELRAQITKIKPNYTNLGRTYTVTAMSYEAAFDNNSEIVLDQPLNGISFYTLAGAPSQSTTITFVLDGNVSSGQVAMVAGGFPAGSKIILILVNGFDGQADAGNGGFGESVFYEANTTQWISNGPAQSGFAGGIVYDAQGIDTDIYFSGATPSTAFPTADGFIRAPGGGGGGGPGIGPGTNDATGYGGHGGGGGAGRVAGTGGNGGVNSGGTRPVIAGTAGQSGDTIGGAGLGGTGTPTSGGNGGGWGVAGASVIGGGTGGLSGSGIKDSGATVTLYGSNATRYINGNGDH